jgi:hypothetical protein
LKDFADASTTVNTNAMCFCFKKMVIRHNVIHAASEIQQNGTTCRCKSIRICDRRLIYPNHNVRRLHDDGYFAAVLDAEFVDAFICNGRGYRLAVANVYENVTGRGPFCYFGDGPFDLITCAEAHDYLPFNCGFNFTQLSTTASARQGAEKTSF